MLVKKKLHCPSCQGELGQIPKKRLLDVILRRKRWVLTRFPCPHCTVMLEAEPNTKIKISYYQ